MLFRSNAPLTEDFNDQGQPTGLANGFYRRLDQQYTLGVGLNFQLSPELSTGLSFNYSKSDSTSQIARELAPPLLERPTLALSVAQPITLVVKGEMISTNPNKP